MFHWAVGDGYFTIAQGRESKYELAVKQAQREIEFRKVQDMIKGTRKFKLVGGVVTVRPTTG